MGLMCDVEVMCLQSLGMGVVNVNRIVKDKNIKLAIKPDKVTCFESQLSSLIFSIFYKKKLFCGRHFFLCKISHCH